MAVGLVFLHGVGQRESDEKWRIAIDGALADLGFPDTRTLAVVVVAPNYAHLLSAERPEKSPAPPRTQQPKDSRLQRRRDYEFGQARLRRLLGVDDLVDLARGPFHPVPDEAADVLTKIATSVDPNLREAGRYMRHEDLRSAILNTVLDSLPACDELVIVGHSLGSLVAIDLLDHLPVNVEVRRLVTIGSPAGLPIFHENSERLLKEFPYGQVKSWLNVVSPLDAVTAGRGLTFLFPAAHDIRVDLPLLEHGSDAYLRQPKVAMAVGEALHGSLSRDLAKPETTVELGLTDSEAQATFALAFAHMTLNEMTRIASDYASR